MSRLTRRGEKHKNFTLLNHDCKLGSSSSFCQYVIGCNNVEDRTCPFLEALDKLAAFEDTNLEPSEILALKAENARLNANKVSGCAWCKGDWTDNFSVIDENFGQPLTYRHVKFCPVCGRKLRSPAEERKEE